MYNGIGLQTARGSGTNGYVQRNLSFVKTIKKQIDYKSEDDFKRLERELNRVPNKEILEHQNKRQIELKCLQMEDQMEQQGFSPQEIEMKVKEFRKGLIKEMEAKRDTMNRKREWLLDPEPQIVKETHKLAEINQQKNHNIKNALGISPHFVEGSSLDVTRRANEAMAKEAEKKKYELLKDPEPEPTFESLQKDNEKHKKIQKEEKKRKKSHKHSSGSDSDSDSYSSDESNRKMKQKSKKRQKNKEKKSRKRKYSDSSSDSDSDSDSSSDSETTDSSDSSRHHSKNRHKNGNSKRRESGKTSKPMETHKSSKIKDSNDGNDINKTSRLIELNIKQMRKEIENSSLDRQNDTKTNELIKESTDNRKTKPELSPRRRRHSRSGSRSSNRSTPEKDSRVKRLKSTVFETNTALKLKDIPKSYSRVHKHKTSGTNRSESADERQKHLSRSSKRRSHSHDSNDSNSSDQSSDSESSSTSGSSSKSSCSRSKSRSPSIPRRKGSPSFLDKRRITSARKRPIPYRRNTPTSSRTSNCSSRPTSPSLSVSSSDIFNSDSNELI